MLRANPESTNIDFLSELDPNASSRLNTADAYYCFETTLREFATAKKNRAVEDDNLRILLIQPPIWKIPSPGQKPIPLAEGGDITRKVEDIDGDSQSTTYGLLSIAAQILKSGRKVLVCNMTTFSWHDVEKLIRNVEMDLVGISCMTYNIRGVSALTALIREAHPKAHIVVGGSHANALPAETLNHYQAINTVVIGEGELTFLEIIEHLESNKSVAGIAGTVWKDDKGLVQFGPARVRIQELDDLASPHEYFSLGILITSRGCPFRCTFCGSETQWGSMLKMNSVEYILKLLELIVVKKGVRFLAIKDDTFTAVRRRTLKLCKEILVRKLNFVWSCDTRINSLDDEVLRAMRMAGCQRISVGIESGSPEILKIIKKKLLPEKVIEVTQIARKYGIQVRFYMIVGNRGENLDTFQESLQLIYNAKPSEFFFYKLNIAPGTEEFEIYKKEKNISTDVFFDVDYNVGKYGFKDNVVGATEKIISSWLKYYSQNKLGFKFFNIEELLEILGRLDDLHSAHIDLAGAFLRAGQPDKAEQHIQIAMEKKYPLTDLAFNYLACIAVFRGDIALAGTYLKEALKFHRSSDVIENFNRYSTFVKDQRLTKRDKLKLIIHNNFPQTKSFPQPFLPSNTQLESYIVHSE
jgi:anaerobic magnesium-protoporphyrin IX monomethyl ester cyclase